MDFAQSSQFHSPTVNDASDTVLTVYSVSEQMNKTTFQCEFTLVPPVFSPVGILTVMGKLRINIMASKILFTSGNMANRQGFQKPR